MMVKGARSGLCHPSDSSPRPTSYPVCRVALALAAGKQARHAPYKTPAGWVMRQRARMPAFPKGNRQARFDVLKWAGAHVHPSAAQVVQPTRQPALQMPIHGGGMPVQ